MPSGRRSALSQLRTYFVLAFGLSWGIGGIGLLVGYWKPELQPLSSSSPLYYLAAYSISLAGIALTVRYAGLDGLRDLRSRLLPWRSSLGWYAIVFAGYAVITGASLVMATMVRSTSVAWPHWSWWLGGWSVAILKDPGPLGEEFGWRGFALPRVLERHAPFAASLRLGLIHAVWHLPLFFMPGTPQSQLSFPLFTIGVVSIAIFTTALYLRTGANLLLAILVHLLANVCGDVAAQARALDIFFMAEGVAATLVVAAGGLRAESLPDARS
jgi:uncharacterized protein